MSKRKSVCLITSDLVGSHLRLQPWRYLHQMACQLAKRGHEVTIVSQGAVGRLTEADWPPISLRRATSVSNPWWRPNHRLQQIIAQVDPEIVLWHVGLTSLLHQRLDGGTGAPVVGIFTSPIYSIPELARVGLKRLVTGYRLSALHVLTALFPRPLLRQFAARNNKLQLLAVQTQTVARQLLQSGLWPRRLEVIGPGIDDIWRPGCSRQIEETRARLGYDPDDTIVVYFGSPAPLRGLHTLLKAFEEVHLEDPSLRLLVLSRRHQDEFLREDAALARLIQNAAAGAAVHIISGFLEKEALVQMVTASDVVALPFELVPSDAPLALLEAQALGKTIVTTSTACLPELAARSAHYLAHPADPYSLATALQQAAAHEKRKRESYQTSAAGIATPPSIRSWQQVGEEWSRLIQAL